MPFYVRLGPRGIVFRLGTFLIGVFGSAVYWRASRRRGRIVLAKTPHLRTRPLSTRHAPGRILGTTSTTDS